MARESLLHSIESRASRVRVNLWVDGTVGSNKVFFASSILQDFISNSGLLYCLHRMNVLAMHSSVQNQNMYL